MVRRQVDGLDHGWPFGDVVDEATGRCYATLQPIDALEKLDPLLVFQGHILLASDGHAVDLKASSEIDGETANLEIAVVAHWRIVLADRGVVLHQVREHARKLVGQQIAGHHCGRERRLLNRRSVQIAYREHVGKIIVLQLAVNHDRRSDKWHLPRP